ncbi:MAG: hypothetical protein WC813_04955 [Patescibacteria group bacterium]|jgi:hypothetical protein
MSEALKGLRECLPGIEKRLREATELYELAVQIGDLKEAEKYQRMIVGAHKDFYCIAKLLLSSGS